VHSGVREATILHRHTITYHFTYEQRNQSVNRYSTRRQDHRTPHHEVRRFRITKYEDSRGNVKTLNVKFLPKDGYKRLIKESLDKLTRDIIPDIAGNGSFAGAETFSNNDALLAANELAASFRKTLTGEHAARTYKEAEHDPDVMYLTDMVGATDEKHKTIASKRKSAPKTLAKAAVKSILPISTYIGKLKLAPGKYESIVKATKPTTK